VNLYYTLFCIKCQDVFIHALNKYVLNVYTRQVPLKEQGRDINKEKGFSFAPAVYIVMYGRRDSKNKQRGKKRLKSLRFELRVYT
jgi:hypothetical protein